jgi:hypothetical protein
MRTTIDLPDDLLRRAKALAALEGLSLKEVVTRCLELGLRRRAYKTDRSTRERSDLPVIRPATGRTLPRLSNADLFQILDEEEAGLR